MDKELADARGDALALVEHFEGSNVPGGDRAERRRLGSSLRMLLQRLSSTEASLEASQSARRRMEEELGEKLASAERSARSFSALVHELEAKLAESEAVRVSLAKNVTALDEERSIAKRAAETADKSARKYAADAAQAEHQAAEAHALRFAAEGHLRAVLDAGWARDATAPAAVREARAWLGNYGLVAPEKDMVAALAQTYRLMGRPEPLFPLPKPPRVEPGQRWAIVRVVVAQDYTRSKDTARLEDGAQFTHSGMLSAGNWHYLGEAK